MRLLARIVGAFLDPERQHGAATRGSVVELWQKLAHVRGGVAVRSPAPEFLEDVLKLTCTSDNYADAQDIEFKEQPESGQIAIVERIFVVPLSFDSDTIFKIIDLMRWGERGDTVGRYFNLELVFDPVSVIEERTDVALRRPAVSMWLRLSLNCIRIAIRRQRLSRYAAVIDETIIAQID